ncbi:MAG: hypothetical protein VYA69_07520 [Gemmatimonadota bacterium]|nr:hypothetical protein [Gemmatimonadota bacterium]
MSAAICRGAGERDGYFPFAANLSRIDTRVSVDFLFDRFLGDMFSIGIAAIFGYTVPIGELGRNVRETNRPARSPDNSITPLSET